MSARIKLKSLMVESDHGKFEPEDIVKVNYQGNKYHGKRGVIEDESPQGSFYIVKIGRDRASFHESDLQLVKRPSL